METDEARLKRLAMRSWRRGTKEMDIILGHFCDDRLAEMSKDDLDLYDALLAENDQDLYQWVTGQVAAPERFSPLIATIADHAAARDH
ncbi:succinate dehydrogenase assembly factor 2 [Maritimibacter sp. DP1N21-5]|uniref:FAD assembly factor SdhE n=1 Tax=Maritimibacter sp. DP1N21-5 TaxID=2836867 RepID=UPI001C48FB64|nr:succinate dehydrogenase assembly factor 2 [Maritimibacter sp. DP1N21-5]MBV7410298.1 succinate dehydrogenase assembly factor 2 [Maritimibacter sp. DP1N21-5]